MSTNAQTQTEDLIEKTAREFSELQESIDAVSRKVSREGLRRVFQTVVRFPYVGDEAKALRGDFEAELLALCVKSESLKNTLNVHFKDKLFHINESAQKLLNNAEQKGEENV